MSLPANISDGIEHIVFHPSYEKLAQPSAVQRICHDVAQILERKKGSVSDSKWTKLAAEFVSVGLMGKDVQAAANTWGLTKMLGGIWRRTMHAIDVSIAKIEGKQLPQLDTDPQTFFKELDLETVDQPSMEKIGAGTPIALAAPE